MSISTNTSNHRNRKPNYGFQRDTWKNAETKVVDNNTNTNVVDTSVTNTVTTSLPQLPVSTIPPFTTLNNKPSQWQSLVQSSPTKPLINTSQVKTQGNTNNTNSNTNS